MVSIRYHDLVLYTVLSSLTMADFRRQSVGLLNEKPEASGAAARTAATHLTPSFNMQGERSGSSVESSSRSSSGQSPD